jgi:hypothetical protein
LGEHICAIEAAGGASRKTATNEFDRSTTIPRLHSIPPCPVQNAQQASRASSAPS